jgi:hypothetical protein
MQEFPDDNQMDELFRKSAEVFEPDYDPAHWQDMAAQLDRYDRDQRPPSVWLRRGLAILLLLWLTGNYGWFSSSRPLEKGYFSASVIAENKPTNNRLSATDYPRALSSTKTARPSNTDNQPINLVANQSTTPTTNNINAVSGTETRPEQTNAPMTSVVDLVTNKPTEHETSPKKQSRSVIETAEKAAKNTLILAAISKKQTAVKSKKKHVFDAQFLATTSPVSQKTNRSQADNTQEYPTTTGLKTQPTTGLGYAENPPVLQPIPPIELLLIQGKVTELGNNRLTDNLINSPVEATSAAPAETLPMVKKLRPLQFVVGVVVSPDLSTIGLRNFDRPGINLGMSLQYQVSKRWSLQTGVLYSQKNYRALTSQYQLPPLKWGIWPTSISGDCRMIDLPINIRYDVFLKSHPTGLFPSVRWFVSAGLTAYWIERESYRYNYNNPNDPAIKYRNWETSSGRQGISNLNLSLGYEKQLNRRLSLQIEPFLKMPLRDIGAYKIKLISTGAFMSVRYRF